MLSCRIQRQLGALQTGLVPLVWDGYLFLTAKEKSLFIFSILDLMIAQTFRRCVNSKASNVQSSKRFFLDKKTFWSCRASGTARPKIWKWIFWISNRRPCITFSGLLTVFLASKKSNEDSATQVHLLSTILFFGSTGGFFDAKLERLKQKILKWSKVSFQGWKSWNKVRDCFQIFVPAKG